MILSSMDYRPDDSIEEGVALYKSPSLFSSMFLCKNDQT